MPTRRHPHPGRRPRRPYAVAVTVAALLAPVLAALAGASPATATAPGQRPVYAQQAAAGAALAEPAPPTYRVRKGDTLSAIARRLGVSVQRLYENNRAVIGSDPNLLRPGQVLMAPAPGWAHPVTADYRISARYGLPGDGWIAGYHTGVDLAVPTGTAVYSVGPGEVHSTSTEGAYGNHILIRMADGHYVLYAHLDRMSVAAGDRVRGGTRIGDSGNTGNSTGPHLHLEVRKGTDYGTDIDPVAYLAEYGIRI